VASEYSVNIRLNTKQVKADLASIKKDIDKLGKVNIGANRRTQRTEATITKSKEAQKAAMVETRRIGDLVQKASDQGLKIDKARRAINRAALADGRGEFKVAKAQQKVALEELKIQRQITKEKAEQARLTGKSMAGGPFVSTGIASSRFGSTRQAGSPRFIASRTGMVQGPEPASVNVKPLGPFASLSRLTANTPLGLSGVQAFPQTKNLGMFGPKLPFIGQTTGFGRSPAGGRSDLVGSLPNLNRVAKDNAMPVKGFEFMPGTPAYFEKFNKDITRIAKSKGNVLPVGGMKHLVGSPAYFKDQAKQLKKLRGGPTGFSAAQYGPQQSLNTLQGPRMFGQAGPAFDLTGQSSPLNFDSRGNLLPGRMGSRQPRVGLGRALARNRGPALQSAAISGAFPLLFGQGPIAAAGGALGGGLGGAFGGQMGGFAGGLIGTAVVSGVQSFVNSIKELGSALDPVNGSASQAIQSLGFLSSARAREIALIEKQIGRQTALAAVRKELADTVGAKQTLALQEAARDINNFQKSIQESLAKFRANAASFMADITPGSAVEREMINRGVATNPESELSKAFLANQAAAQSITGRSLEARIAGFTAPSGFLGSGEGKITQAGKAELKRLKAERDIMEVKLRALGIENKVSSLVKDTNITFMEQLATRRTAFDLESRVLELRSQGINPAIAKEMAMFEKINSDNVTGLQSEIDLRKEALKQITDPLKKEILLEELTGLEEGLKLLKDQNKERIKAVQKTMELNLRTDLVVSSAEKLKETLVTDLGNGIKELIRGTSTLNDVLNNVLNKMIDAMFNMAFFGNAGGTLTKGLGLFGNLFGGLLATGGPAKAGKSYIVGERGPELFTPGVSGMVSPNSSLGGSTNVVVNVDASGSSAEGDEEQGRQLGLAISAAVQSELIQQKRPGGLLA